ncbi:MAG TPA: hypothetical protein VEL06_08255 [Haliangiales bacterium]|nr:hypothetical protein [Haliangiales bacterium]
MTDLNQFLKSARVPERPPQYWEQFPDAVVRRLRQGSVLAAPKRPRKPPLLIWATGFATACLVIGFGMGVWQGHRQVSEVRSLAESARLIHEVAALFPHRVRAIISDDSGVRLVLSDQPDVPYSTPLWVRLCQGKRCQTIVTFSGQEIRLADQSFEVLADARDNVLLVGKKTVWSSADPARPVARLKIRAKALEVAM